jgi:CheY-like chemotaxis protein
MKVNSNYKQASVLIVEDNDDQWLVMRQALQLGLPEVKAKRVTSADEALCVLREGYREIFELPRLIFLDLYLPGKQDGLALHSDIKELGAPFTHIPVVMFSSSEDRHDICQAYQNGISSYLVKPTTVEGWIEFFKQVRAYWWDTARLPSLTNHVF